MFLRSNYGGDNEDNGNLLQKVLCMHCHTQCPQPCSRLPPTQASARNSWTLTGKSESVSCEVTAPFSWVLAQVSLCALQESVFPILCKIWRLYGGVNGDLLQEGFCHTQVCCTQSPCLCGSPLLTWTSAGDTQTQFCLSLCGVSGSWGLFEPSEHLWQVWGLLLNAISPLLTSCCRAGQKGHSGFSVSCNRKTQMNFLASSII